MYLFFLAFARGFIAIVTAFAPPVIIIVLPTDVAHTTFVVLVHR